MKDLDFCLVAGIEPITFPEGEEFGAYSGRKVSVAYDLLREEPSICDGFEGNELEGAARDFALRNLGKSEL